MNHIFVKGSVLGVEFEDIENKLVTPLSRPLKQPEYDRNFGTNSMYNSVSPSSIPKQSFLNPSAIDFNLLVSSHFKEDVLNGEKTKFNKTGDIQNVLREINKTDPISKVNLTRHQK